MQCPLCGKRYEKPITEIDCAQCAHYEGCDIPRCPTCYYENVLEPRWYENVAKQTPAVFEGRRKNRGVG